MIWCIEFIIGYFPENGPDIIEIIYNAFVAGFCFRRARPWHRKAFLMRSKCIHTWLFIASSTALSCGIQYNDNNSHEHQQTRKNLTIMQN